MCKTPEESISEALGKECVRLEAELAALQSRVAELEAVVRELPPAIIVANVDFVATPVCRYCFGPCEYLRDEKCFGPCSNPDCVSNRARKLLPDDPAEETR